MISMTTPLARVINIEGGEKTYLFDSLSLIRTSNTHVSNENSPKPPIYLSLKVPPQNYDVTTNVTSWNSH